MRYQTRYGFIDLKIGELIVARNHTSEELKLSPQQFRTAIKLLNAMEILTSQPTNRFTKITLINYEKYQKRETESTSELTSSQPAANQQLTTDKEVLEGKEEYSTEFESILWKPYPARKGKKQGKKPAYKVWQKLNPTGDLLEKIRIGVLAIQKEEYPRDAVKWLRDEGWNDEVVKKPQYNGASYV